jgi:phytoene dehydrogenase-like protein
MADAEVIIVGAGHNGLICGAYLARAGISTMILESRLSVGGCASTVADLGARFNICHCEHTLVRSVPVVDELELGAHGLDYLEADATSVFLYHDETSEPWVLFHDIERTLDGLSEVHPEQLDGYRRYLDDAIPVAELILEMARTRPSTRRFATTAIKRRARGARRLVEWSRMSFADVFGAYLSDWRMMMAAVSTGPTVWGVRPELAGTGLGAATLATRHLVRSGRPRGGSGALTDAVKSCLETAGGEVRCGARVEKLLIRDGEIHGVRLADGSQLTAPVVVAACDPHRVFVDWIDEPPAAARRLVSRWRRRPIEEGYESKLDVVLQRLPRLTAAARLEGRHPGLDVMNPSIVVVPTPDELDSAHRGRGEGRVAERPTLLMNFPSVLDPGMAPRPDAHVASIEVLYTPYSLRGGWAESDEPRRWLGLWADLMEPGAMDHVTAWRAMIPPRYEAEFSMYRGHTPSFAGSPLAALVGRQRELTRYRTPITGLYLTGAGTFPGAGISGAPGRNAADVIERDLTGRIGRRPRSWRRRMQRSRAEEAA